MKAAGMIRRVDNLGRIVIPKELRTVMDIKVGDTATFFVDNCQLIVQKYETGCLFCGNAKNNVEFKGKMLCRKCLEELIRAE